MGLGDALTNIWENYTPVGLAYKKFYEDPANAQKAALDKAQQQSLAEAEKNRQFQLQGLDRALTFYGPARSVLSEMMGGVAPASFGQMQSPPPNPSSAPGQVPGAPGASAMGPGPNSVFYGGQK